MPPLGDVLDSGYSDPNTTPPSDFSSPPAQDLGSSYVPSPAASSPASLNYSPAGGGYTPSTEPTPPPPPAAPRGVGAYGAAPGGAPPDATAGGLSPEMQARIANYRAPAQGARFSPTTRSAEVSPVSAGAQASIDELTQARMEQFKAQQGYNAAAGQALQPLVARQQQEQADLQNQIHSSLAEHVQKIQDLTATAGKAANEEPEDFWGGDNVGKHILRTFGMAAMAFGHGLNPNAADPMAYMNAQIKASADKQKAKVDAAKGNLERETNLYATMKQKFGDDESAMTATQMMQKQAVLDKLDESFQKPSEARTTWGQAPEKGPENPFDNLPPTARLNLANARVALAESIHADQMKLDATHINKITSSEQYHRATGGGQDPLAQLERVAKGTQYAATIGTAVPKAQADVAREQAAAAAETAKSAALTPGADRQNFETAAGQLGSTSILEHPVDSILQHFQGTDAQEKALTRNAYNANLLKAAHKMFGRLTPESEKAISDYQIRPNDTEETIRRRVSLARQNLFSGAPAIGVTPGETEDVP